jgi:hypothetical protein
MARDRPIRSLDAGARAEPADGTSGACMPRDAGASVGGAQMLVVR